MLLQKQGLGETTASAHGFLFSCRPTLLFCSTSLVPVGRRTYANVVSPVSGSPGTWEPARCSDTLPLGPWALSHPHSRVVALQDTWSHFLTCLTATLPPSNEVRCEEFTLWSLSVLVSVLALSLTTPGI